MVFDYVFFVRVRAKIPASEEAGYNNLSFPVRLL